MAPPSPASRKRGNSWTEEGLKAAINAVQRGQLTQRAASLRYNLPRRTLRDHLKTGSAIKRLGRKPIFTDSQESDLAARIKRFAKIGMPLTPKFIKKQAFLFCERYDIKNNFNLSKRTAGNDWLRHFLKRNPSISKRKPQIMNPARAQKLNKPIVEHHFQSVKKLYDELDILQHPERLYNMDEKGCRITVHHQQTVLAEKGSKRVHLIAPEHAENVTIAMCINAIGTAIPPMILFKGQRQRPDLVDNLPAGSLVKMAPKGSMTADLFIDFIQHLGKYKVSGKCLLIFDGAKCHLSSEALDEADKNEIVLYCLPSNTTHELQPLDKSVNKSYEHHWDEAVMNFLYVDPDKKLTKATFNKIFSKVWPKCITHSNIVSGFKATGLFPFNPEAIAEEAFAPSILSEIPCPTSQQPLQDLGSGKSTGDLQNFSAISEVTVSDFVTANCRLVEYSSSSESSDDRPPSRSILAPSGSGLQQLSRAISPLSRIASNIPDLNFLQQQNTTKLTVADVYGYSSSEEDNGNHYFIDKGDITPKKQTIDTFQNIDQTNSDDSICSDEDEDNVPLSTFKKQNIKTPFQEFLPTPNYAIVKTKNPRKKAMNYKGQRIMKDLFTRDKDEKQKKRKQLTIKKCNKKQKETDVIDKNIPKGKEKNIKEKRTERKRTTKEGNKNMQKNKENEDGEEWYCHACCTYEKLAMRLCSNCKKWFHEECVGLTKSDKEFTCPDC